MQCIKTGCDVYVEPYGEWLHGDAFQHGNLLFIRSAGERLFAQGPMSDTRHFTVHAVDEWWDKPGSMQKNSTLVSTMWVDHGYDGIPEEHWKEAVA